MTNVVTFVNFKGGTGKTTNSTAVGYALSNMGYSVLLLDFDPQANATNIFLKTRENNIDEEYRFKKTLMGALTEGDLSTIVTKVKDNLYLLPSYRDLKMYPDLLEDSFRNRASRVKYLSTLVDKIKDDFDFVFIDVPPTFSIYTNSALYCSDGVVIVMQAHEFAINGVEDFLEDAQEFIDTYEKNFSVIGILPVILKPSSLVDQIALKQATEKFGEDNIFNITINHMERLRRWGITGITEDLKDINDRKVHHKYEELANELLTRMGLKETNSEEEVVTHEQS